MSLEDPNDPNVQARGQRMKKIMPWMHALHANALQVALAQNMPLPRDGSAPMASGFVPSHSDDSVTLIYLQSLLTELGISQ